MGSIRYFSNKRVGSKKEFNPWLHFMATVKKAKKGLQSSGKK
jgi:hypothetical protein